MHILIDTREQQPWEFNYHSSSRQKLDTGDYSIQGLEQILTIERKKSVSEIANNISEKRWQDVLNRMSIFPYKFILMEFNLQDVINYPIGTDIPKKLWDKLKISNKYILKCLTDIQIKHNIHILYCGDSDNAQKIAINIMRTIYKLYESDKQENI